MRVLSLAFAACLVGSAATQTSAGADPWQAVRFLEGTWDANVQGNAALKLAGRYTFARELNGHVLARHSTTDAKCTAPASFDCAHGDLLYLFEEMPGAPLQAIYFDNEGHVIRYDVTTPGPDSVVLLSEPGPGPQFRLSYQLASGVMSGKFEMHMPGQDTWKTYLQWSGGRK